MTRRPNDYARPDRHTRAAKAAGYPARSVFKLEEIHKRYRLFKSGQRVLDLGAAPGSWSLYASQCVGPAGRVLAVDLSEITEALPPNVQARQLDVFSAERAVLAEQGPYHVVLSDMAPRTSGNKARDQALSYELCMKALAVADDLGAPSSHFVAKLFMSPEFGELKRAITTRYAECRVVRPEATRSQSSEVFLVGLGRKNVEPAASP
ncbi:MAG TPA: RlmE family RNA methyltransferase [Polyangiaceae bacterium]|nr:RlmE family RNA methyltransferase [Polyangiaceae bacterium]